jgi:cullin 3
VLNYLDPSTEKVLISTFLKEYIETHALSLIQMENSGLIAMIKNDKFDEIALMFELFSKVPEALTALSKNISNYIN